MADRKFGAFPAAGPVDGSEILLLRQGGRTVQIDRTSFLAGLQAALGFTPEDRANRNAANGYVGLVAGKVDPSVLPKLNFNQRFEAADQAAMLALAAAAGDIAVRADEAAVYLLTKAPATTLANWTKLGLSAVGVSKVISATGVEKTGSITITIDDVADLSPFIRTLLDAATDADARTILGLGSAALEPKGAFALASHTHPAATRDAPGLMSAADKRRLESLVSSGGVPTGAVMRFPSAMTVLPDEYLALTAAVQKFDPGVHVGLDEALGLVTEPATPGGFSQTVQTRLQAGDAAAADRFGYVVSLSNDGNTMAVGSYLDDNSGGANAGSAYIFVRDGGGVWTQQARIQAGDAGVGELFGFSIALSGDGNTVAVGALNALSSSGAVYVFTRAGSTWTQQNRLTASDAETGDAFGTSVAISFDGTVLVIGSPADDNSGGANAGSVYLFTRGASLSSWSQRNRVQASSATANFRFGATVAMSSDGNYVIVGEPNALTSTGRVYVFTRSGSTLTQQVRLAGSDSVANDGFGTSLALSQAGSVLVVGSPLAQTPQGAAAGAVYVFTRSGDTWSQAAKIRANDPSSDDSFGEFIALSGDGGTLVVAADDDDNSGGANAGSAYVFVGAGATWNQQIRLQAADAAADDRFGFSVSISGDGTTLAACAFLDDNSGGADAGSVYVFKRGVGTPGGNKLNVPAQPDASWKWGIKT